MRKASLAMQRKTLLGAAVFAVCFLVIYAASFFGTFVYSTFSNLFEKRFVGFANYAEVFRNRYFRLAFGNTARITLLTVGSSLLLAFPVSCLLAVFPQYLGKAMCFLILPLMIPSGAIIPLWRDLWQVNTFSTPLRSTLSLVTLYCWKYTGTAAVILAVGMTGIPHETIEAAALDGAGKIAIYRRICLPQITRHILFALVFLLMFSFRLYKENYLLFGDYPDESLYMIQHYMNNHFLKLSFQNTATAAATLACGMLIPGAACLVYLRRRRQQL